MKLKQKQCKECGELYYPYNSLQQVCSYKCAIEFNKPERIEERYNIIKNDARPLIYYEKKARKAFQEFVRLRDKDLPCISCGATETQQWDGSHYFSAEQYSGLIFDEINCNKGCCYCNRNLHGNLITYREGLIKKYGKEAVVELTMKADKNRTYKYTKFELLQIEKNYKQKIKILKSII